MKCIAARSENSYMSKVRTSFVGLQCVEAYNRYCCFDANGHFFFSLSLSSLSVLSDAVLLSQYCMTYINDPSENDVAIVYLPKEKIMEN